MKASLKRQVNCMYVWRSALRFNMRLVPLPLSPQVNSNTAVNKLNISIAYAKKEVLILVGIELS